MEGLDFKIFFNHGEEISQFWPFWQDWIKNFLQPRWRNHILSQFGVLEGINFNIVRPWWRNHLHFSVNLEHLEGLDFKIVFNHGEEISQFWPFRQDWIENFLQLRWRNHLRFWVNLQHLKGLDFKIFFNHGEEISQFWPFWQVWVKKVFQSLWRNHLRFWVN